MLNWIDLINQSWTNEYFVSFGCKIVLLIAVRLCLHIWRDTRHEQKMQEIMSGSHSQKFIFSPFSIMLLLALQILLQILQIDKWINCYSALYHTCHMCHRILFIAPTVCNLLPSIMPIKENVCDLKKWPDKSVIFLKKDYCVVTVRNLNAMYVKSNLVIRDVMHDWRFTQGLFHITTCVTFSFYQCSHSRAKLHRMRFPAPSWLKRRWWWCLFIPFDTGHRQIVP